MNLTINQNVIFTDHEGAVECFVRRINKNSVTLHQRNPKLKLGRVQTYCVPKCSLKKYVKEENL